MPHLNLLPLLLSANAIASHRQKAGKPQVGKQCKTFTLMSGKTDIFITIMCGGVDAINNTKLVYNLFFQSIIFLITYSGCKSQVTTIMLTIQLSLAVRFKKFQDSFPILFFPNCVYIKLWMHQGGLESTQEARVARGAATLTLLLHFPNFLHAPITRYTPAKHEPIL